MCWGAIKNLDGHVLRTVQDEVDIEQFVREIERHGFLMEDSAIGEELRK